MDEGARLLRVVDIAGGEGGAVEVGRGEHLSVIDVEGSQVADLVALRRHDLHHPLSVHQTRSTLRRLRLQVGDVLVDTNRQPLFAIARDDVGVHDLLLCACSRYLYEQRFGISDHRNCRENLLGALAPYGVEEWWLPDPLNVFMDTPPQPDGGFAFNPAPSKPGDRFVLRALDDVVVAVSSCPMDLVPINAGTPTPLRLEVTDRCP